MAIPYYERTQTARPWALLVLIPIGIAVAGVAAADQPVVTVVFVAIGVLIALLLVSASALHVSVSIDEVEVGFRLGWPNKSIPRSHISGVEAVRNRWWYGWGIRLTPHGWLWNVWGLDAVRISLASGKTFTIGTDDPDGLAAALG